MKAIIASVTVASALVLSGCAGTPAPSPTVTVTAEAKPEPSVTMEAPQRVAPSPSPKMTTNNKYFGEVSDAEFVAHVKAEHPALLDVPSVKIVELALSACELLDVGGTKEELARIISEGSSNMTQTMAFSYTMAAGVANYCGYNSAKLKS